MKSEVFPELKLTRAEENLLLKPVLVALSGGADSVALLRVLMDMGLECLAAHCNFHLRGEESMRDERFVRALCQELGIPLVVKDFDVPAFQQTHGGSVEMACRELRYTWFEEERQRLGCGVIAVAHHADDQIETFFLNLFRGTGVRGLAGMRRLSGSIWRPLLDVSREDIINYLNAIGQDYVTDSTNAQNDYRRNRLRNIVLPVVGQQFPSASARIIDSMANLSDDHDLLTSLVNNIMPDERHIDLETLMTIPQASTLLYHRIRHLGFNREQCVQAVDAARQRNSGRQFPSAGYVMHVNRQSLDIEAVENKTEIEIPLDLNGDVISPVKIAVTRNHAPFSPMMCDGKCKVAFHTDVLHCQHVILRHWRQGDRIKPFGLNGNKLVSDLFADLKLTHAEKHAAWLLEADGDILWVLGFRASALYPVPRESQDYLLLTLTLSPIE